MYVFPHLALFTLFCLHYSKEMSVCLTVHIIQLCSLPNPQDLCQLAPPSCCLTWDRTVTRLILQITLDSFPLVDWVVSLWPFVLFVCMVRVWLDSCVKYELVLSACVSGAVVTVIQVFNCAYAHFYNSLWRHWYFI